MLACRCSYPASELGAVSCVLTLSLVRGKLTILLTLVEACSLLDSSGSPLARV